MWSDNGTNFVGAEKELKEAIELLKEDPSASRFGITWKFNPPTYPWMGGSWEVLVKLVKRALK